MIKALKWGRNMVLKSNGANLGFEEEVWKAADKLWIRK